VSRLLGALGAVAALALAACSKAPPAGPAAGTPATPPRAVRLILDYLPNAAHAGFYQAEAAGYYRQENLQVRIDAPTSSSDTLRLMAAGQAEFGIVSLLDFVNVRAKGEPLKIVMAVEQRPLAALISLKKAGITRPRDLVGRLVGVTGVLSDDAGVRWMIQHDGGDPAGAHLINIGFNTAQEVIAGNVDAAFGFWSQEGVQVAARQPARILRLYEFGAPPYPELIVFAREDFLAREPETARRFLRATVRGYRDALSKPDEALAAMAARIEGDTVEGLRPYLAALAPVIKADAPDCGTLNLKVLGDFLGWVRQTGVLDYRADPAAFATNEYLPPPPAAQP
jgi:NitT/TauT family transport system substrate-binding protein/putative hydroxymethylpyrimidine transport system substrate-binding protein